MSEIVKLSDDLINKIAAGEVVERPASVVKELVENALDAGATRIEIELKEGGLKLIRVTDNGKGIARVELPLACERHATSKISRDSDLFNLSTMGFRGEALASIASVSRFQIQTKRLVDQEGSRIVLEGGQGQIIESWSHSQGTSVVVEDLFFNIPARKNFLKNPHGEYAHVLEWIQALALARPQIGFTLVHNEKVSLKIEPLDASVLVPEELLRIRIQDVLKAHGEELLFAENKSEFGSVKIFFSQPGKDRSHAGSIYSFINGRWIQNKNLRFAILRGYHSHLMKGRFPVAILYLQIDPTLVDVNVHPAKTEVRLQYSTDIQNLVAMTIREKLREGSWSLPAPLAEADLFFEDQKVGTSPRAGAISGNAGGSPNRMTETLSFGNSFSSQRMNVRSLMSDGFVRDGDHTHCSVSSGFGASSPVDIEEGGVHSDFKSAGSLTMPNFFEKSQSLESTDLNLIPETEILGSRNSVVAGQQLRTLPHFDEMRMLGSFVSCFLFFEFEDKLLCLDQHAFHERILYEKLTRNRQSLTNSQQLLISEVVELRPTQVALLLDRKLELEELGFKLNEVSPDSIEVQAVPAFLAKAPLEVLFTQISKKEFVYTNQRPEEQDTMHHILSTMACHGAVRAGDDLTEDEIRTLFAQSETVDFWHNCPHGRPVLKWFERKDVENWFSR
jgi:DNA mismatch repair protein MutL